MWSKEFNSSDNEWGDSSTYHYKSTDHPKHFDFTIDEVVHMGHDSGTAGTHWYLSVRKDIGNGRTRLFYGIGIHVADWCKLFKREIHRLRNNEPLTRYTAVRAREHYWVEPDMCEPPIDSSLFRASTEANQKRMVG